MFDMVLYIAYTQAWLAISMVQGTEQLSWKYSYEAHSMSDDAGN